MITCIGFVLLVLAFLLPGHYLPWLSFEQQAMAAFAVALVGLGSLTTPGQRRFRMPALAIVSAVLAVVPGLQWVFGQVFFASDALLSGLYLCAFFMALVIGASPNTNARSELTTCLFLAFIAAGIVSTGIALMQLLEINLLQVLQTEASADGRPFGNLNQRNHLATLLALGVVSSLHLFEKKRLSGPGAALAIAWFAFGMVMSQSRTGWAFATLLLIWWALMRRRAGLRLPATGAVAAAMLFVAAVVVWYPLTESLQIPSEALAGRLTPGARLENWRTLWDAALQSPWLGYGWSQVTLAQQAAVLDHGGTGEWLLSSHNIVLDLILQNGFPIGMLVVVVVAAWFVRQIQLCRSPEQWTLLAGCGAIWLHALVEFPLEYSYFLLPLGLMMGLLESHAASMRMPTMPRAAFALILLATTGLAGWISIEYLKTEETTRQLRFVMSKIGTDKFPLAPIPDVVLLDQIREYHRFWITPITPGMSEEQMNWIRRVVRRQSSAAAMLRYASAAGLNGHPQEARDELARLCKMQKVQRCDENRKAWQELQTQYPELRSIEYPSPPQMPTSSLPAALHRPPNS